jgi:hypothetical protein
MLYIVITLKGDITLRLPLRVKETLNDSLLTVLRDSTCDLMFKYYALLHTQTALLESERSLSQLAH